MDVYYYLIFTIFLWGRQLPLVFSCGLCFNFTLSHAQWGDLLRLVCNCFIRHRGVYGHGYYFYMHYSLAVSPLPFSLFIGIMADTANQVAVQPFPSIVFH